MDDLKPGQVYLVTYRYSYQRPTAKPTTRKLRFVEQFKVRSGLMHFSPLRSGAYQVYLLPDEIIVMTEVAE